MSRLFKFSLLLALLVPATAFADFIPERGRLFMAAKYAELEQLGEKEIRDDPNPSSAKLMPLCVAYGKLKRYNKLFPCLDRLEANIQRGDFAAMDLEEMKQGNPLLFGLAMMGSAAVGGPDGLKGDVRPWLPLVRAEAYTELHDYDKAIASAQLAFDSIPQRWNEERSFRIFSLTALGLSHALAGKKEEAAKYAETLTQVSTSYPYSGLTNDKLMGIAKIYIALGDYQKAYDGMRSDSLGLGALFLGLGDVIGGGIAGMGGESLFTWQELPKQFMVVKTQLEIGEVKEAKEGYDALLAIPRVRDNGEIYWVLLFDRGRIAAGEGDLAGAIDYWKQSIEVIEQQRSTINTEASKIGFVGDKQAVYKRLVDALFTTDRLPEAFDFLERSKSRALVDMLAAKNDFAVRNGDEAKVRDLLVQGEIAELESRAQDTLPPQPGAAQTRSVPGEQRVLAVSPVNQAIAAAAPELASLISVSSTPIEEIQDKIGEDEALIEYYYDDKSLFAFVLTRQGLKGIKLEVGPLEADTKALRELFDEPASERYLPIAQRLYQQLIQPLNGLVAGKSKLIIVPHGALHYLPFAVLNDGSKFLIDKVSLRFLPSASVVKYLRAGKKQQAGILAFGNPDLGDARYDLQFAEKEAVAVGKTWPQSRVLLRKEATETAFQKYAAGFNYLHFATHGQFSADAPLNSALLLAKDQASDGQLTVGKLYSMKLDADLVTLSACETGLGKVSNGDDVVGLTRGFLYAGASTVVASLWKVDDQATSELMNQFYLGLKTRDKREALRQAQLSVRQKYPNPYFWAAFQLTGNAQ